MRRFLTPTKKNFFWMMTGNAVYTLCQWGMLVALTKLGNPEVVGEFALALAVISPIIMITNIQLRGVQATDASRMYRFADYTAVRVISIIAGFLIILSIITLGRFEKDVFWATFVLTLAKAVESMSDVFYGLFQQNEKMGYIAKSMILKGTASVVVLTVVFYYSSNLVLSLTALGAAWALIFLVYDCVNARKMVSVYEVDSSTSILRGTVRSLIKRKDVLKDIVLLALPLGIVMGIISFNTNIPRYMVEKYLGTRELGFFAALAYATWAVNMFIQALGQAVSPRLAVFFADGDLLAFNTLFKKLLIVNLGVGLMGVFAIVAGGKTILSGLYTTEYGNYAPLFLVLMISAALMGVASAYGYAMTAAREFRRQVPLFLGVALSTMVFCAVLIPKFHLQGAAFALIFSSISQIIGSFWILRSAVKNKIRKLATEKNEASHADDGSFHRPSKRVRHILHVVGAMNTGGIETWLMHVLRNIDRECFQFDFLVHTDQPAFYDAEIKSLGCKILPCLYPNQPFRYARNFLRVLKENGPYDVVHSHVHHFSGFALFLACLAGVPIRIAHSHNDTCLIDGQNSFHRIIYFIFMKFFIWVTATWGLSCSRPAATSLFGKDWEKDRRWKVLYYGIDLRPFDVPESRESIRRSLGIDEDSFVIGHVGRFVEQKNHEFLIEIFKEFKRNRSDAILLLVGDGPLRSNIESKINADHELKNHVVFAGIRSDIPALMKGVMDVFVFPSCYEGLGIVLIEAQAAGLPCVYSDNITDEIVVIPELMRKVSLATPSCQWAEILGDKNHQHKLRSIDCCRRISSSPINLSESVKGICRFYD